MKDRPVSIRLDIDVFKNLEKICKKDKIAMSKLCGEIIDDYLVYYRHAKKNKDLLVPKNNILVLYNSLDHINLGQIINEISDNSIEKIRSTTNSITYESVRDTLIRWFAASNLELDIKKMENNLIRLRCKHDLDKHWSFVTCNVLIAIFNKLKVNVNVEDKRIDKHVFHLDVFVF